MKYQGLLLVILYQFNVFAVDQTRVKGEDYSAAAKRLLHQSKEDHLVSAYATALPINELQFPPMVEWKDNKQMINAFKKGRDLRFLNWYQEKRPFKRRSTWLYPDNGCYARAELLVRNLLAWKFSPLYKAFVFGNLEVESSNSPDTIYWWYHVVPVVKLQGEYFVFDPAIFPSSPLPLNQWLETMVGDINQVKVSICSAHTYDPGSPCLKEIIVSIDEVLNDQDSFLDLEWERIETLGRIPMQELGDSPPWN